MNIKRQITGMNTCDTMEKYITVSSHPETPSLLPSMATSVQAIPWFMQGFYANPFPWQSLLFPPSSILPVPPTFQHQLFHCASPQPPNHTNKSFLIKDILDSPDSTSQTTAQITGDKIQDSNRQLQSMPPSMFSFYILPTQKERYRQLGYSRTRTIFTQAQINELEANFEQKKYLSTPERFELAKSLGLNPVTVKTWYQNKRMKWKKEQQRIDPSCKPTRPKGRPPKYSSSPNDVEDHIVVD